MTTTDLPAASRLAAVQEIANKLVSWTEENDPGMKAATLSQGEDRRKHAAIAAHYTAYGIRAALLELGLLDDPKDVT